MEHAICYVSTATVEFSDPEINALLDKWKDKNSRLDIKGILLYSESHFFQVLEGEKFTVLGLYNTIIEDPRHTNIIQVLGKDLTKGSLDDYITDHLTERNFSRPDLIRNYCESVKGMDSHIQEQIKQILEFFIDTQVL